MTLPQLGKEYPRFVGAGNWELGFKVEYTSKVKELK